jgi:hypothetical protein
MAQTGSRPSNLYHTPLFNLHDWLDFQDNRFSQNGRRGWGMRVIRGEAIVEVIESTIAESLI